MIRRLALACWLLWAAPALGQQVTISPPLSVGVIANSLGSNVALSNTGLFFDGPTVAQGSTGTWCAGGTVTMTDSAALSIFAVKLWDGTTVIASADSELPSTNGSMSVSLFGCLAAPAGNLRISVKNISTTTGRISFNDSGSSKDSTITAWRVQ